jgi:Ser/Thr protein kinase RdoA (MazF antagonist)
MCEAPSRGSLSRMTEFAEVCALGSLEPTGRALPARESLLWLVRHSSDMAVLRRLDAELFPVDAPWAAEDLAWMHRFLTRLSRTGFPSPTPLPVFDGRSWIRSNAGWWDVVTYLPGVPIGWQPLPASLARVGELMARYHQASRGVTPNDQRPSAIPMESFNSVSVQGPLTRWIEDLRADLDRVGHAHASRCVVHGDFTMHNVLAAGTPADATGVIDFTLAYIEDPLADIGFGLWRSGRPHQEAVGMDLDRVTRLITGYHQQCTLQPAERLSRVS